MIKIAYVINYIVKNGPSGVVLNLIENLDRKKYDVSLITLFDGNDNDVVTDLRKNEVKVYECKRLSRMKCLMGRDNEFVKIIEREQFDILHTHGFIPDILSSRLIFDMKKITTIHNNMYEDYLDTYGYVKSHIFIALHIAALKRLDICVCCSESVYQVMKHKLNNATYIRNGIEPAKANSIVTRAELGIPDNARVFLFAGVLNSRKNIVWLIENFVSYHNADEYLLVLGKGEKEGECLQKADNHVIMLGFQSDPIAYMNISDVYVSASKSEGFSISVLEALSCGLGLFLSDIPSHKEVVEMGRDIYLGEIFDAMNFKNQMTLFGKSKLDREKIVEFQKHELSAKIMTIRYMKCYEDGGN